MGIKARSCLVVSHAQSNTANATELKARRLRSKKPTLHPTYHLVKIPEFSVVFSHIFFLSFGKCFALQMPFPSPALCFLYSLYMLSMLLSCSGFCGLLFFFLE